MNIINVCLKISIGRKCLIVYFFNQAIQLYQIVNNI